MTKDLHRYARAAQAHLMRCAWPVPAPPPTETRIWIDAWAALVGWHEAGEHVYRVRPEERIPILRSDTNLATAGIRREAQAFVLRARCIVVARIAKGMAIPISSDRSICISARGPVLCYMVPGEDQALDAGYISLADQPTISSVRLIRGEDVGEIYSGPLADEPLRDSGLMLARVFPLFFWSGNREMPPL